jgi:murein L,D-transpeptidase YcbB/YkuD
MTYNFTNYWAAICGVVALSIFGILGQMNSAHADEQQFIRSFMEVLERDGAANVSGTPVYAKAMGEIYAAHQFEPIWDDMAQVDELLSAIKNISKDGLDPQDLMLEKLLEYRDGMEDWGGLDAHDRAEFDILLSEALGRIAHQLLVGKVDPSDLSSDWNMLDKLDPKYNLNFFDDLISDGDISDAIDEFRPDMPIYDLLQKELAKYQALAAKETWVRVPDGDTLKPGMSGPRVQIMRARLVASGDLSAGAENSDVFDDATTIAVKAFQRKAGLYADGLAGRNTILQMNVSARSKVDTIRVNLERVRWVAQQLGKDFILTNIANYHVYLVRDNNLVWDSKAMVGLPYRQTPVFRSQMKYIVFNPTWTVPPGILRRSILPKIKEDRAYLDDQNMMLVDFDGVEVDPASIDWDTTTPRNFRWSVVQRGGPGNALGEVKFIFPNKHYVFLHDTSHRELFVEPSRAFSSGCIRVEDPHDLAALLLEDQKGYSRSEITKIVEGRRTQTKFLSQELTVLLMYLTAWRNPDGSVDYYPDVYNRDGKVLAALDAPYNPSRDRYRNQ